MPQMNNQELVDNLSPHFVKKWDASYSWLGAISAWSLLPQLRGFWPTSSVDENGDVYDLSGQGRTLTNVNAVTFGARGLAPYAIFTQVATNYLLRNNEAGIQISGELTIGCWCNFDNINAFEALMSRWVVVGNRRSFKINKEVANTISMYISSDGTALGVTSVTTVPTVTNNTWYFIVGRFVPNVEVTIFIDKIPTSNLVAPALIWPGNADLYIGRDDLVYMDGRVALHFLCASALPDSIIQNMFEQTKAMFGKK